MILSSIIPCRKASNGTSSGHWRGQRRPSLPPAINVPFLVTIMDSAISIHHFSSVVFDIVLLSRPVAFVVSARSVVAIFGRVPELFLGIVYPGPNPWMAKGVLRCRPFRSGDCFTWVMSWITYESNMAESVGTFVCQRGLAQYTTYEE